MGVPGFYKWIKERYPKVIVDVIEEEPVQIDGISVPVDSSKPNTNKIEFDNLYLDLNGLINPSWHPEDRPSPETLDDVFQNMVDYIDRIFEMVRPRKLLYMALDGVAPMAKMNQQRSRRFKTAKEEADTAVEKERLRQEFEEEGKKLPPKGDSKVMIVTVGSKFIAWMISALRYYIHVNLKNDPGWRPIKVILSDAYVPGEAEHKIMDYIRLQRNLPSYDPNTRHCLYGLDADLIMLALISHEVHVSILREIVFTPQENICSLYDQSGHFAANCAGKVMGKSAVGKLLYEFLNIWTLREYLDYVMRIPNPPFEIDLECILDDFIFMCFFIGNDFLPPMPTLETREGAIDLLIAVYIKEFAAMGGYLTDSGKPILNRVEHFIQEVGSYEGKIFQKRRRLHQRRAERVRREKEQARNWDDAKLLKSESLTSWTSVRTENEVGQTITGMSVLDIGSKQSETSKGKEIHKVVQEVACSSSGDTVGDAVVDADEIEENKDELIAKLLELLQEKWDPFTPENQGKDMVKLGELGWNVRYYKENFSAKTLDELATIRKDVVLRYTEGLCWLMHYYYEGICSWQWFYPYHYAPFASDLKDLGQLKISFELGLPLKPFDQLMGVLPVASSHELPEHYRKLMTDPNSPIIDFYPTDFEVDLSGKWYSNQGVAKLPFIDEGRLLAEIRKVEHTLTEKELRRNCVRFDMLFVAPSHPLSPHIVSLNDHFKQILDKEQAEVKERLDPIASDGMNGYLAVLSGVPYSPTLLEDIMNNQVMCAIYRLPDAHKHTSQLPAGVVFPKKFITEGDLKPPPVLWHEDSGKKPWEKIRQNLLGTNARRQLGDAARQLIVNSLQLEKGGIGMDQMKELSASLSSLSSSSSSSSSSPSSSSAAAAEGTCTAPTHSNFGKHSPDNLRLAPHGGFYHGHDAKGKKTTPTVHSELVSAYRHPYSSSSSSSSPSAAAAAGTCTTPTPSNFGNHSRDNIRLAPHGGGYHNHYGGQKKTTSTVQNELVHLYRHPYSSSSAAAAGTCIAPTHSNFGNHSGDSLRLVPHGGGYHGHGGRHKETTPTVQNEVVHGYRHPYSSSSTEHSYEGSSYPRRERNNWAANRRTDNHPTCIDGYQRGSRQNSDRSHYHLENVEQTPRATGGAHDQPTGDGGYSEYRRDHQASRATDHHNQKEGSLFPPANPGRNDGLSKQLCNRNSGFR